MNVTSLGIDWTEFVIHLDRLAGRTTTLEIDANGNGGDRDMGGAGALRQAGLDDAAYIALQARPMHRFGVPTLCIA